MTDNFIIRPIVQAISLTKHVRNSDTQLTILQDINLDINAGEAVSIVGASGSGKSTLLGLLAGLDTPSSGKVYLNGEDIFLLDENIQVYARSLQTDMAQKRACDVSLFVGKYLETFVCMLPHS